jgi:hypothetical protein
MTIYIIIENERIILPLLNHSNIIRVIDTGAIDVRDGEVKYKLSFIVEPFVRDASTINQYVQSLLPENRLPDAPSLNHALIRLIARSVKRFHRIESNDDVDYSKTGYFDVIVKHEIGVDRSDENSTDVFVTYRYAHPDLKDLGNLDILPGGIIFRCTPML